MKIYSVATSSALCFFASAPLACSAAPGPVAGTGGDSGQSTVATGGASGPGSGGAPGQIAAGGTTLDVIDDTSTSGGSDSSNPATTILTTLPPGFIASPGGVSPAGGWQLLGALADLTDPGSSECANVLRVIVRDFEPTHPDFGSPKVPSTATGLVGVIGAAADENRKPIRAVGTHDTVMRSLNDWYHHGPGIENVPYVVDLWLEPQVTATGADTFVFDSGRFFPLEGVGALSGRDDDRVERNFAFTTELHTKFQYQGGETFSFRGDDDVFVYINGQLQVDLGGVHGPQEATVNIDTLGLVVGEVYNLDLFQAERNPSGSNFRIETTLDFTECGEILPIDIIVR